ncbi:MAG: hypothetical protein ACJ780_14745 [Solirubrobacteraceae bacterium]
MSAIAGQIAIPPAGDLADDATRGRVIGTVMAGFLAAPWSLARCVLVAQVAGWRAIYVAAIAALMLAVLVHRNIPTLPSRARLAYPALLASVGTVIRQHRVVRWTLLLSGLQFGVFMMLEVADYLLSAPPFSYPVSVIGLFGPARTHRCPGRATCRPAARPGLVTAGHIVWALALLAVVLLAFAQSPLALLVIGIVLLHLAIFPLNVLISTRLFALAPGGPQPGQHRGHHGQLRRRRHRLRRSRTAVVRGRLAGGHLAGFARCALGLAIWAIGRRGPRSRPTPPRRAGRCSAPVEDTRNVVASLHRVRARRGERAGCRRPWPPAASSRHRGGTPRSWWATAESRVIRAG